MEALRAGCSTLNESGLPDFHDLSRGFIPWRIRRIGAVETAPQSMEALRAGCSTLNESGLPDFHGLSRGFIPRRIRRIDTPRRIDAPRLGAIPDAQHPGKPAPIYPDPNTHYTKGRSVRLG